MLDYVFLLLVVTNKPESRSDGYIPPTEESCSNLNLEELCASNCRNFTKFKKQKLLILIKIAEDHLYIFPYHLLTGQCLLVSLTCFLSRQLSFDINGNSFVSEDLI